MAPTRFSIFSTTFTLAVDAEMSGPVNLKCKKKHFLQKSPLIIIARFGNENCTLRFLKLCGFRLKITWYKAWFGNLELFNQGIIYLNQE